MRQFAFVIHPLDVGLVSIAFNEPSLEKKKRVLVKKAFEWLPSFKCADVEGIVSKKGYHLKGSLIYCSLLPEQIISLPNKFVLERIISGGKIAQENGADILGLGAYTAYIGKKGIEVAKALDIPVTTGTHYTIHIAIESVLFAAKKVGLKIEDSCVSVVGATGAIGQVCAQIFAEKASRIILVSRNKIKLNRLAEDLSRTVPARIFVEQNLNQAIRKAQICIMATTTPEPLIDMNDLCPGTIVCDISRPRNVSQNGVHKRDDVLVIDGGLVRPPGKNINFNFYFGLPKTLAYACMAETMILALEERYESFSIGGNICLDKVRQIAAWGQEHGFELAKIRSFDNEVPEEIFENIRRLYSCSA